MKDQERDKKAVSDFYDKKAADEIAKLPKWTNIVMPILMILSLAGGIYLLAEKVWLADGIVLSSLCFIISIFSVSVFLIVLNNNKQKTIEIKKVCNEEKITVTNKLAQLYAEYNDNFVKRFNENGKKAQEIKGILS